MKRGAKNALIDLTAEYVRQVLDYNPNTGLLYWKVALSKRAVAGKIAGFSQEGGRIKIGINGNDYMAHRIIWLWMTGEWPEYEVDHRDEDKSNNRWKNLRRATPSQNHRNRGLQKNNTTGYKGVCFDKRRGCYIAGIKLRGVRHNLGSFTTAKLAHKAYKEAAARLHGKDWAKF